MSFSTDLAEILQDVTSSLQTGVATIHDRLHVNIIDYVQRGCSMKTVFIAYVDLIRFADDVSVCNNSGNSLTLAR